MSALTHDIVAKLWNLCNVLKDDGVTYHQYVIELTYLLFLKMAKETQTQNRLPVGYSWDDLKEKPDLERLEFYKTLLVHLGLYGSAIVKEIYTNAISFVKKPKTLSTLVEEIDKINWFSLKQEGIGDLYEGLLEKNASEKKSGAGQYFTTRPLIESIVHVMQPKLEDIIQDPAAGTGGFLIAADRSIRQQSDPSKWTNKQKEKHQLGTFYGMEHVQDTYRLGLMNLSLHGLDYAMGAAGIHYGDTLSPDHAVLPKATLMLSNPPFGSKKGGGLPDRPDFPFQTSNKQFCFLQHIYLGLQRGGRAAVILPDNVLFEGNTGKQIRVDLMNKCNLHTILRLPSGIFYAQGVKTNVLFFTRGETDTDNTKEVWVYDLRAKAPKFNKNTPLTRDYFAGFEQAFGYDPYGKPSSLKKRISTDEQGRFRKFSRETIAERNESLDFSWLKDPTQEIPEPAVIVRDSIVTLESALGNLRSLLVLLGEEPEEIET
jgi:type I restriction enzyme M protein